MRLCAFKNLLGEPGKGIHATRIPILNWAFFDTAATALAAYWLSVTNRNELGFAMNFILLLVTGRVMHSIFCVGEAPDAGFKPAPVR